MIEQKICNFILETFPKEVVEVDMMKVLLFTRPIVKLPEEMTTGNHLVFIVNIEGDISVDDKEYDVLFVCAGAGIAAPAHKVEDAVSEVYLALGRNQFSWQGESYNRYSNLVGCSHGIDIADTNRVILIEKTSEFKKYYTELGSDITRNKLIKK